IEERVLKAIDRKRELFAGVFEGTTDEVDFDALGHQTFLETVRALVEDAPPREEAPCPVKPPAPDEDAGAELVEAGVCGVAGVRWRRRADRRRETTVKCRATRWRRS